jgi:formamidopyrimidine-DNA glycosylase
MWVQRFFGCFNRRFGSMKQMPELPEVEVTRRSFAGRIEGGRVVHVRMGKALRWPLGVDVNSLSGLQVGQVFRRGKYLWLPLLKGLEPAGGLLLHLGMSGSLAFLDTPEGISQPPGGHDHFDLLTSRGLLRLHDPRRFGAVVWGPALDAGLVGQLLARLGVEPLSDHWTPKHLRGGLAGRRVAIKQALLAGDVVVGVGNIYASEALFRAGIHPETLADRVGPTRCERLVVAVREVLAEAVEAGGTTLRDFKNAHGQQGHFQLATMVYDRAGEPCRVCLTPVKRIVQGQRATYFCPKCQRR